MKIAWYVIGLIMAGPRAERVRNMKSDFFNSIRAIAFLLVLLPRVRKVNWIFFSLFSFACASAFFELIIIKDAEANWVHWYHSLSSIELVRFYTLIPLMFYLAYLAYRLVANEVHSLHIKIILDQNPELIEFLNKWQWEKSSK